MKIIYISGKISGLSEKEFKNNFKEAKMSVWFLPEFNPPNEWILFKNIISPLDIKPFLGIKSWFFYMVNDLLALRKCTHIAMQKNWIDSKGACIEHFVGKFILKLEVIYL